MAQRDLAQLHLDQAQQAVLSLCAEHDALSVFGAPGTGKSYTLRALVRHFLNRNSAAQIAVLAVNRRNATALRNHLSIELGGLPKGIQVRSITAFAFGIVAQFAQLAGRKPPALITGPDQDAILQEAFEIAASGLPSAIDHNLLKSLAADSQAYLVPAFRADFRDLLTRAAELELSAQDLTAFADELEKASWKLGAQLMETYEKSLATAAGTVYAHEDKVDHARLVSLAARHVARWRLAEENDPRGLKKQGVPHWDLVVVDDVQNAPLSLLSLLRELQKSGARIVTFGDPDAAVEGYRGGVAHLPMIFTRPQKEHGLGAVRIDLAKSYRVKGDILQVAQQIQAAIHTAGGGSHRKALNNFFDEKIAAAAQENVRAQTYVNESAQIADIANEFKRLHIEQGVSYAQMAVLTRSSAEQARFRQLFTEFQIPVEPPPSTVPLREAPLAGEIISLIAYATKYESEHFAMNTAEILRGRIFGYAPNMLRRITQQLHGWELKAGGTRNGATVLTQLRENPTAETYQKVPELQKICAVVHEIQQMVQKETHVQEALWQVWDQLQLADVLQQQALRGGERGALADNALDAVMQLFRFTQRVAEREGSNASMRRLLDLLEAQDLPEDSIAKSGNRQNQIALSTAAAAIGQNWDYVAVVNLNEGNWPNTKMRNPLTQVPLLNSTVIHRLVAGAQEPPRALQSEVIDDELRMFLVAVTRAKKQLYLSAVESAENNASAFLQLVAKKSESVAEPAEETAGHDVPAVNARKVAKAGKVAQEALANERGRKPPQARSQVFKVPLRHIANDIKVFNYENELGKLRIIARHGSPKKREEAQQLIAKLRSLWEEKNPAHLTFPEWIDELALSTDTEFFAKPVISPSLVEKYLQCPLVAFYEKNGARADDETTLALSIGSLVHKIAELYPDGGAENVLKEKVEELWGQYFPELSETEAADQKDIIAKMLTNYNEYVQAEQRLAKEKYVELAAHYQSELFDVRARIDRLEIDPRTPTVAQVIDFKTGKNQPTKSEAQENAQLRVYQWLIAQGSVQLPAGMPQIAVSSGAELVFLRKSVKSALREQAALKDETIAEITAQLQKIAAESPGPNFLAEVNSKACPQCKFQVLCPGYAGKRVFS